MANPTLTVKVNADTTSLGTNLDAAGKTISAFGASLPVGRIEKLVDAGKKVVDFLQRTSQAGADAINAENQFALAMGNMGVSVEENSQKINDAITAAQDLGFTDDDARKAIEYLTRGTGDLTTALGYLPAAMDLARSSGKDLTTAADALGESLSLGLDDQGVQKVGMKLTQLMGGVGRGVGTFADTLNDAGGAAATWAAEPANSAALAKIQMDELKESMSQGVSGAMKDVQDALGPLITAFGELLSAIEPALTTALGLIGDALGTIFGWITKVLEKATEIIDFFKNIVSNVQDAIDKTKEATQAQQDLREASMSVPTGGLQRPGGGRSTQGQSAGARSSSAGAAAGTWAPFTINIYGNTAEIEARVKNAIRNYNRRNGAGAIFSPGRS